MAENVRFAFPPDHILDGTLTLSETESKNKKYAICSHQAFNGFVALVKFVTTVLSLFLYSETSEPLTIRRFHKQTHPLKKLPRQQHNTKNKHRSTPLHSLLQL